MAIAAISEAIVAGWLLPNPPKALASPAQTSGTRKKFADLDLFRVEKPGKTHFFAVGTGPGCTKWGPEPVTTGAKTARPSAAAHRPVPLSIE